MGLDEELKSLNIELDFLMKQKEKDFKQIEYIKNLIVAKEFKLTEEEMMNGFNQRY